MDFEFCLLNFALFEDFLFKEHLHRLVEQPALYDGINLGTAFRIALQAEEAGGIALVDRNLHVPGTVEQHQFFSLRYVGIGAADPFNHFFTLEHHLEPPALALLFELLLRDVHDDILKVVDEDDLTFDPVLAQ